MSRQSSSYSNSGAVSATERVAKALREQIRNGQFQLHERLPAERELAAIHGVSRVTLRRALNMLAEDRLIERRQGKGTFVSNPAFASATRGQHGFIAIVCHERKYYFDEVMEAASAYAARRGYGVTLGSNETEYEELKQIESIENGPFIGVLMSAFPRRSLAGYTRLLNIGIPVVFMESFVPGACTDFVRVNNAQGMMLAVQHLAALGHQRIGYIGHNEDWHIGDTRTERLRGYRDAMFAVLADSSDQWLVECQLDTAGERLLALLQSPMRPTAIISYNDKWAIETISIAQSAGVSIPGDLSVVGFDNSIIAQEHERPLTSVSPQRKAVGCTAVDLLLRRIEGDADAPAQGILISPQLIVRQTTGPVLKTAT